MTWPERAAVWVARVSRLCVKLEGAASGLVTVFVVVGGGVRKRDVIQKIIKLKEQGIKKGLKDDPVHKTSHVHPSERLEDASRILTSHFVINYKTRHTVVTN